MAVTSAAFNAGSGIPARSIPEYGNNVLPLSWSGVPNNILSLAQIIDDLDAPDPRRGAPGSIGYSTTSGLTPAVPQNADFSLRHVERHE